MSNHTDDGKPVLEPLTGLAKFGSVLVRVLFSILCFVIVIIALPFFVLYACIMAVFGKGVTINLKKTFRLNGGK